jgi:hypothetical protein
MHKSKVKKPQASAGHPASPTQILREAIRAVPVIKYALGIAGIAAAMAVILSFQTSFLQFALATTIMFVLMSVLMVLAKAWRSVDFRRPLLTFVWFSVIYVMSASTAIFTSFFFDAPLSLKSVVQSRAVPVPPATGGRTYGDGRPLKPDDTIGHVTVEAMSKMIGNYARELTFSYPSENIYQPMLPDLEHKPAIQEVPPAVGSRINGYKQPLKYADPAAVVAVEYVPRDDRSAHVTVEAVQKTTGDLIYGQKTTFSYY